MKKEAIQIIIEEHSALYAVLYTLHHHLMEIKNGIEPDFKLLKAILDYIDYYPKQCHHPKEDQILFKFIKEKIKKENNSELFEIVESLELEHHKEYEHIDRIKFLFEDYLQNPSVDHEFLKEVDDYVSLELAHIEKEEKNLLTKIESILDEQQWQKVYNEFKKHDNPLVGIDPEAQSEHFYQKILALAESHHEASGPG